MRLPIPTLALIASILSVVTAKSSTGDRVLVVLESGIEKGDYSKFWKSLEGGSFTTGGRGGGLTDMWME